MTSRFALVLVLAATVAIASAVGGPCSALQIAGTKTKYNLTPLEGKSYSAVSTNGGTYTFNWGVCSNIPCGGGGITGVCQTMQGGPGGPVSVAPFNPNKVVVIPVKGGLGPGIGIQYQDPNFGRIANIFVLCDKNAKEATGFKVNFSPGSLSETDLILSHVSGCGIQKKLSAGSIMLIVLTVCLVLYFILGFLWKKFKQQKEGCDAVPNFLWKDLPSLVADGFRFLVSITCGRGSSSSSGGYEQM